MTSITPYPIIDLHCHGGNYRAFHIPENTPRGMLHEMDSYGVSAIMLSSHQAISADYREGNRLSIEWARRYPGRIWAYMVVNPNYPDEMTDELETCLNSGVVRGIKIHPELNGDYPMDGSGYETMWAFAAEHRLPVLFHTYFGGDRLHVIDELAATYPTVTMIVGHAAVDLGVEGAVELANTRENVVLDITAPQNKPGIVEFLVKHVSSSQLAFGSDMPFLDLGTMLGPIIYADISEPDREAVLYKTSARILGLTFE